tara:strand:- start:3907 stop:4368 length:462 start_codon:yes stop_codon:yes gene_type:complete
MKKLILFSVLIGAVIGCQEPENQQNDNSGTNVINNPNTASGVEQENKLPVMTFEEIRYDFGQVVEGEFVEHKFVFENTGNADLLVHDVRAECGCTVPNDWPKQAVKPGEKASISVKFNSVGREGEQVKRLTITANTYPVSNVVALAGEVVKQK